MSLFAAVRSKEQIQHVLKSVGTFPETSVPLGSNLQDSISSAFGGTYEKIVYASDSRTHGLSSVLKPLKPSRGIPAALKAVTSNNLSRSGTLLSLSSLREAALRQNILKTGAFSSGLGKSPSPGYFEPNGM